jgi:hypothetical protein
MNIPGFDFSSISFTDDSKHINPREIFMALPQKDAKYEYPRDVQSEVWKKWFANRNNENNIIKMNTGSGKTVVALMILQSCINEGYGPAVYVVPDPLLVKQVIQQANSLGIKTTDDAECFSYKRGQAILVINICKLVNGKSVFGMRPSNNIDIGSVVLDDIHACLSTIQNQYIINIEKYLNKEDSTVNSTYNDILALFTDSLKQQSQNKFFDIKNNTNMFGNMLVPFWDWQRKVNDVYEILFQSNDENILYSRNFYTDILKMCHCYVSARRIQIIPHCIPIHKIKSLVKCKRKIFLSATLSDDTPFVSVFDLDPDKITESVTPEQANDIGERFIMFPQVMNDQVIDDDIKNLACEYAKKYNVIILVGSRSRADFWIDKATVLDAKNINDKIDIIKKKSNGITVILNKYDGIDLPDDSYRVIIIDGLPNIAKENDKYEEEIVDSSERIQRE